MSQQNKLMGVGQSAAAAAQIVGDVATGLTAAGTGQTTALALSCACNYVETVASGTGVRLYGMTGRPSSIGDEQAVYNAGANTLSVYPPSGEQIVGAAQDAAFSVPAGVAVTFKKVKNTLWLVVSGDAAFERFIQSGTGALTSTVSAALRLTVHTSQYDTTQHYVAARDALTGTTGVNALDIGINGSSSVITFPARTSGRGAFRISSYEGTFSATQDPVAFFGYNYAATSAIDVGAEPACGVFLEGNYNDGSGANKMEMYFQWSGLPSQAASVYRPFFTQANRTTGSYQNKIAGLVTQFVDLAGTTSVMDVYSDTTGILLYKKMLMSTLTVNANEGIQISDTTPHTVYISPSSGVTGLPLIGSATAHAFSIFTGGLEAFRVNYVASAVNQVNIVPAATTGAVTIQAIGSDATIGLNVSPKGAATLLLGGTGGEIQWARALIALGGGAAPTLGTIGGSGPAASAQNSWLKIIDNSGVACYAPVWK